MFKFIKNKFLFIVLISVITLVLVIVGAISLYKDNSKIFTNEGYIIEATAKANKKYYFSANTKYKENVDERITFSDTDSNTVAVDPASFVHYLNGDISFLKKGALVNLAELNAKMVSYYNVTDQNTITKENNNYSVSSNGEKINIESFIGRISDNKYIVAGNEITLQVPKSEERISGEYFEVLYIEKGIIKIDNQENSYQVTAQDSYIYIGDNITINLGNGRIFYDGDAKMLLSQITISGDENIDLDVEDGTGAGGGGDGAGEGGAGGGADGEGEGDGTGEGGEGDGTGEDGEGSGEGGAGGGTGGEGEGGGTGEGGEGDGTGAGGEGSGGGGAGGVNSATASPQIELIEAKITSTTIDLSLQLNNASLAKGEVVAYLTNVMTGDKEYAKNIDLVNGTFTISKGSLSPSTEYALTITETYGKSETQYFQKVFKTKDLGLVLEKVYATEDSLSYSIVFDENTEVTKAHISIYDNNGVNTSISPNEFTVSKSDLNNTVTFTGLKSNTSYSVSIDNVSINSAAYSNVYTINRIDTTLKKTPVISGVNVGANAEEVKFNIKLANVVDVDKSIISYTYNIYLADDINLENPNPEPQYSVTKNDADALVLNLNEIDELKTGVDYRCKVIAEYNDNEMVREVSTDYSNNFLIKSKPQISFELKNATMNKVEGIITLLDANCTVPMNGRSCSNKANNFTLRYYKLEEEETTENDRNISFDASHLTSKLELNDLSSNTTYAVKVFGNYYDDDNLLHENVQLGDTFYVTTDKSENLHFEVIGDNTSGKNKDGTDNINNVVTFDAKLSAPQNSTIMEEISTITFNLYSGKYNVKEKLIGSYTVTNKSEIEDLFSNITITNSLFDDVTRYNLGKIDKIEKLIRITNNSTGTLNGSYTVEVEDVYDSSGVNKIVVENNIYTFNLTPAYYLDARIETTKNYKFVNVTPIKKENLTEEETTELTKTVKNLDSLNKDTVVGVIIENNLSDAYVDSAFTYEKVEVNYIIYNETTKKEIKRIVVNMGNKYQPKTLTVYLDPGELDDGENYFTRGYKYKIGYTLNFTTEDGSNPVYDHEQLHKELTIDRQAPFYTQYISTSDSESITYKYKFTDIDGGLFDKNFYYTVGEDETIRSINNALKADNTYHEVTIPMTSNSNYALYYGKKDANNALEYVKFTEYKFEKEYNYNEEAAFTILNDSDNVLKLRLEENDVNNRAIAYKVIIQDANKRSVSDYTRYFLASNLNVISEKTGTFDIEGNEILKHYKYIGIDYAKLSRFMGYEMKISVYSYYDSGLVGLEQKFEKGFVLKNDASGKYLNIYNTGSTTEATIAEDTIPAGLYFLRVPYNEGDNTIAIYNHLLYKNLKSYKVLEGATYISSTNIDANMGITFDLAFTNAGTLLTKEKKDFSGYNFRVLKEAELKTNKNTFEFDTITPTIDVSDSANTINSLDIKITPTGIYSDTQFQKNGATHNKVYVDIYSDKDLTQKLAQLTSNITITSKNDEYTATINNVEYENLTPNTTYYFTVSAYINNKYTRLYDSTETKNNNIYTTKVYETKTLDGSKILNGITFKVEPKRYAGESSEKEINWNLSFLNTKNFKVRFELYEPDGTTTIVPETGEEKPNHRLVKINGSKAASCDKSKLGSSDDGYVTDCYISVSKDEIASINKKNYTYKFTGDNFIFGDNYYKLVVYAIPYTNGKYNENHKVVLYQNDSLKTEGPTTSKGITYDIAVPFLKEAKFSLETGLLAGYSSSDKYYISFKPTIADESYVVKYGTYTVKLKDAQGTVVSQKTDVPVDSKEVNNEIKFTNLDSNTLYYVELSYSTYRNNVGFTEKQKTNATPYNDFIYTPIDAGITLGTITAKSTSTKSVTLTYNGASNLSQNISRVHYTISLKGGSSITEGDYILTDENDIFTINSDKIPRLIIDVSDENISSNPSFTIMPGSTYIINTQYWYMTENGEEKELTDQNTGNSTYTTILN